MEDRPAGKDRLFNRHSEEDLLNFSNSATEKAVVRRRYRGLNAPVDENKPVTRKPGRLLLASEIGGVKALFAAKF